VLHKREEIERSVLMVAAAKVGRRRAVTVCALVALWSEYRADHGTDPVIGEVPELSGRSLATAYRWLADFRDAFPQYSTPGELLDAVGVPIWKSLSAGKVMDLLVPEVES
jgi:hypothetical protein